MGWPALRSRWRVFVGSYPSPSSTRLFAFGVIVVDTAVPHLPRHRRVPVSDSSSQEHVVATASSRTFGVAVGLAVALGIIVRAYHVLSHDFPLNDGGLFYAMVRDLQAAHYRLPAFTSYNDSGIPFGYSPLGFYLAGFLDDFTPLTLVDAFRWLPLVASCLIVVVFADLARALLRSRTAVIASVLAFALVPRSYIWLLMGGGVTRSLGFLFGLLTIRLLYALYTERRWRWVPLVSLTAALTAMSHLGTAPFVAFSGVLFLLGYGRHRQAVLSTAVAAVGAAALSAPWWLTVVGMHGIGPFLAAGATGGTIFRSLTLGDTITTLSQLGLGTAESVLALIGMLGALGFFYSLGVRDWLLPAWWIAIVTLDARQGSTFSAVPIALLAGVAVARVVLPALEGLPLTTLRRSPGRAGWSLKVVLGVFLLFALVSAFVRTPIPGGMSDMGTLSPGERQAIRWVGERTPASARILIVAGTPWEIDRTSEWLPALAHRRSVATVQGYEWRPIGEFARKKREYNDLQGCAGWVSRCLRDWSAATGHAVTHVYLPKSPDRDCCHLLRWSLDRDPDYRLIYDGPGAAVFVHAPRRVKTQRITND
jgi:hypothetical protein